VVICSLVLGQKSAAIVTKLVSTQQLCFVRGDVKPVDEYSLVFVRKVNTKNIDSSSQACA